MLTLPLCFALAALDFSAVVWSDVAASLHPLVLHLPIGLFVALAFLELPRLFRRPMPESDRSRSLLVLLLVLVTPVTATTGWFLNGDGEYGSPVEWHQRLGIAMAVLSLLVGLAYWRKSEYYPLALWAGMLLLIPTAHFGASLTHGEDFLTDPWRSVFESDAGGDEASVDDQLAQPDGTPVDAVEGTAADARTDLLADAGGESTGGAAASAGVDPMLAFAEVQPIFVELCSKCHGTRKRKGKLALHDLASVLQGGENGPVLTPGDPAASRMVEVLRLPLEADEHMPPEGKSQPTADQITLIEAWIAGLSADALEGIAAPESIEPAPLVPFEASPDEAPAYKDPDPEALPSSAWSSEPLVDLEGANLELVPADPGAIAALRAARVHVEPIEPDSPLLWLDFTAAKPRPGQIGELLKPIAGVVAELSLFGQAPTASELQLIGALPRLTLVDLRGLDLAASSGDAISVLDLGSFQDSGPLRVANLSSTPLGPVAVEQLAELDALERVYLWNTGLSAAELEQLAAARPELEIVAASAPVDAPLEVEPEVAFVRIDEEASTSVEGDPDFESDAPAAADLTPENATCPVSDEPVDPRYTIVHAGRVIGFCCPNCPKSFWSDPAPFLAKLDAPD